MTVETAHPALMARASLGLPTPYVAPEGKLETELARIFADVFGLDQVGANDDFFDIGGDSLVAETVSMEILKRTGCEFPISSFLEYGSPRSIARALHPAAAAATEPERGAEQARPPIFVVHGRGGYTLPQPEFFAALAEGQKLRMFELPGIRGGECYDRIEDIAEVYIGQLTGEYPQGPILLASFCAGGLIALEMAARLAERGRPVVHLVLIDPAVRKNGTLGFGASPFHLDLVHRFKRGFQSLLPRAWRLRYYDLKWSKRLAGNYPGLRLSPQAQAKLMAAFRNHRPKPYTGSVTILASSRRVARVRDGLHTAHIMPNRTIRVVVDTHREVTSEPEAARAMQEAFDAALARRQQASAA
jgi:acyl carrier protein/alpha-beta hydrolase superfamily lysophospholipase